MDSQQMNRTMSHPVQPSFPVTTVNMAAPPTAFLKPQSHKEMLLDLEKFAMLGEYILDSHPSIFIPSGIAFDRFVSSGFASGLQCLLTQNDKQDTTPISPHNSDSPAEAKDAYPSTASQSSVVQVDYQTVEDAVNKIFQYKGFWKHSLMANSPLHNLVIVQQARKAWMDEQGLSPDDLCQKHKTIVLREFLTKCLNDHLCPEPGKSYPKDLSNSYFKNEWIEYLILRGQYVEGKQRKSVKKRLKNIHGGTYGRRIKEARARLAKIIWELEMQAR